MHTPDYDGMQTSLFVSGSFVPGAELRAYVPAPGTLARMRGCLLLLSARKQSVEREAVTELRASRPRPDRGGSVSMPSLMSLGMRLADVLVDRTLTPATVPSRGS